MIVLAILATLGSLVWSWIVLMANGMSSSPSTPFQGGWSIIAAWLVTAALWFGWWVG